MSHLLFFQSKYLIIFEIAVVTVEKPVRDDVIPFGRFCLDFLLLCPFLVRTSFFTIWWSSNVRCIHPILSFWKKI